MAPISLLRIRTCQSCAVFVIRFRPTVAVIPLARPCVFVRASCSLCLLCGCAVSACAPRLPCPALGTLCAASLLLVSGPRLLPSAQPLRVDRFPVVGPAIAGRCRSGVALIIAAVEGLPSGFGAQEGRQLSKAVCPGVAWRRFFTFWIFSRCIACASHALSSCQLDVGNSFCRWRGFHVSMIICPALLACLARTFRGAISYRLCEHSPTSVGDGLMLHAAFVVGPAFAGR